MEKSEHLSVGKVRKSDLYRRRKTQERIDS